MTTGAPDPLDLHHEGAERVIGVYLLETEDGLALQDCGPSTCITALKTELAERALVLSDVRHLLLSHIHLDHAGAAGTLVREHPGLQVHVSEIGAPHLVDPSRLELERAPALRRRLRPLWGELAPVPQENVHVVGTSRARPRVLSDAGPRVAPRLLPRRRRHALRGRRRRRPDPARPRTSCPSAPPPEIDLEAWERTIDELELRAPERLALIHFGVVDQPRDHLRRLRRQLRLWGQRVRQGMDEEEFVAAARADLEEEVGDAPYYERAAPFWQSYLGLKRYWDKRGRL